MTRQHTAQIPASAFAFLTTLKKNNNRDWFNEHKDLYLRETENVEAFADALLHALNEHDVIETLSGKKSLHRIYRDTRFSKDKTPYKTNWSGSFSRATRYRRGGYYFHLEPGNSLIAGGFWGPDNDDLKRVRDDIAFDPSPLQKILASPAFADTFGELKGEQLKTVPKGFDKQHEAVDLLRFKQYLLIRPFSDQEVFHPDFLEQANQTYRNMRPFFDYMSDVLTIDGNGE